MSILHEKHLILDCIDTWPKSIIRFLTRLENVLHKYRDFERKIDNDSIEDVMLRYYRPVNKNEKYWNYSNNRINEILKEYKIIGFHCTRYTEEEVENVLREGLSPLSKALVSFRVRQLVKNNLVSNEFASKIIEINESNASNRKGNICFFHCLSTLKDESGLYRLFRAWGGEAVYINYEPNIEMFDVLKKIGKPCIVVASINPNEVCVFKDITEKIINIWLDRKIESEIKYDCDSFIKRNVNVLEIIKQDDQRFEEYTEYKKWSVAI